MKYNYLLYEPDLDGRTGKVTYTPIAIFSANSKEEAAQGLLHIMAKHLANGNYPLIAEFKAKVAESLDSIKVAKSLDSIKEAVDTDNPQIVIFIDNTFFIIQPFKIDIRNQTILPAGSRNTTLVHFNEETGIYTDVSSYPIDNLPSPTYEIEIVTSDANPSPFLSASPFVVKGTDLYALDAETGTESGPYQKTDFFGGYYLVYSKSKDKAAAGIISLTGKIIADCIYDSVANEFGYAVLEKEGKLGFYSPYEQVLIPCQYDDLEFPEDTSAPLIATKDGGIRGLIATDGTFHPLTDEDPDPSLNYL